MSDTMRFIESQLGEAGQGTPLFETWSLIKTLFEKRLWYQLTEVLKDHIRSCRANMTPIEPPFSDAKTPLDNDMSPLVPLFNRFIFPSLKDDISPLALAELSIAIAETVPIPFAAESLLLRSAQFLGRNLPALASEETEETEKNPLSGFTAVVVGADSAYVRLMAEVARRALMRGDVRACRDGLEKLEPRFEALQSLDPPTHAAWFRAQAEMFKARNRPDDTYRAILSLMDVGGPAALAACGWLGLSLGADPAAALFRTPAVISMALDSCLAGLLSHDIYDVSEMIATGLPASLADTPFTWVAEIFKAVDAGDLAEWARLDQQYLGSGTNASSPAAALLATPQARALAKRKTQLAALTELAFSLGDEIDASPAGSGIRTVDFTRVAKAVGISQAAPGVQCTPEEDADTELLLIKAMSLGIISGSIDQPTRTTTIHTVRPRGALRPDQVKLLARRFQNWADAVLRVCLSVESATSDTFSITV